MENIRPAEVSELLKKQIQGFTEQSNLEEVGTVLQVGDGDRASNQARHPPRFGVHERAQPRKPVALCRSFCDLKLRFDALSCLNTLVVERLEAGEERRIHVDGVAVRG